MSEAAKPGRPWQEIAEEASREHDSKRLAGLMDELTLAFDELDKKALARATADKSEPRSVLLPPMVFPQLPRKK